MNLELKILKRSPDEHTSGGATTGTEEKPDASADTPPAKTDGPETDDYGYEDSPAAEEKEVKETPVKKQDPAEEPAQVEAVSGYGDEPPKVEDPPPAKKEEPVTPPVEDELDKVIDKDLPKEEAKSIKEFATKHKMSPEQVKAYSELRRDELKAAADYEVEQEKQYQAAKIKQRADWHTELKNDKDFGGEKFKANKMMVDRVLSDHMPSTKKMLTEHKGILPPYLMRDLAKIGQLLHPKEKHVSGNAPAAKADETSDSPLDFYE